MNPQAVVAFYEAHDNLPGLVRLNREGRRNYKVELGPYADAAHVLQNPADDSAGIFEKNRFQTVTWEGFQGLTSNQEAVGHFDADTALTVDTSDDPTALLATCCVDNKLLACESY